MASFVLLNWLVDIDSPRVREDIPVSIVVVIDRSVALESLKVDFDPWSRLGTKMRSRPPNFHQELAFSGVPCSGGVKEPCDRPSPDTTARSLSLDEDIL